MFTSKAVEQMIKARKAKELTDLNIICGDEVIPIHAIIICSQSAVFHAACTGSFKDHSLDTVHRMIDYLYTGDYDTELSSQEVIKSNDAGNTFSVHAKTFALADQYLIHGLKILSVEEYRAAFAEHGTMFNFLNTIRDVYTLTPDTVRELRETAVGFARQHLPGALHTVEERDAFEAVTAEVPAFAKDLLYSFLQSPCIGSCVKCKQLYRSKFRKAGT